MKINDIIAAILSETSPETHDSVRDLLWTLHATETHFLSVDLNTVGLEAVISSERLTDLKNYQCERIGELRRAAYLEEFDSMASGVTWDGDDDALARAKRTEIKSRYPWPGTYR